MRKFLIAVVVIYFGVKYGVGYILSEKFQAYGDQTKKPWTCKANNVMAEFFMLSNKYQRAYDLYGRVLKRCPKTKMEEIATFKRAVCLEGMGRRREAQAMYDQYAEKYPGTERAKTATRAAQAMGIGG